MILIVAVVIFMKIVSRKKLMLLDEFKHLEPKAAHAAVEDISGTISRLSTVDHDYDRDGC